MSECLIKRKTLSNLFKIYFAFNLMIYTFSKFSRFENLKLISIYLTFCDKLTVDITKFSQFSPIAQATH